MKRFNLVSNVFIVFQSLAVATPLLAIENIHVVPQASRLEFLAKGSPGFLKIHGKDGQVKGSLVLDAGRLKGELIADLNNFKTGIELRDQHMKEKYLETGKFRDAVLVIDNQSIDVAKSGKQSIQGQLSLHGVNKAVPVEAQVKKVSDRLYEVESTFPIVLSEFNIDVPKYLGVTVAQDVVVTSVMQAEVR